MCDVTGQVELDDLRADVNRRAASLFAVIDDYEEAAFLARADALATELPDGDADGLFHQACARDSWGHSDLAVPLYREALERGGLTGENRRRAVIQLSSSRERLARPPALDVADRADTEAGPLGEFLLRQARTSPVTAQEWTERAVMEPRRPPGRLVRDRPSGFLRSLPFPSGNWRALAKVP